MSAEGLMLGAIAGNLAQARERIAQLEAASLNQRRQIHNLERHNQHFERCESSWCNPSEDPTELSKITPGDWAKLETITQLEAENKHWGDIARRGEDIILNLQNDKVHLEAENTELRKEKERLGRNCLMLARREKRRADTDIKTLAAWAHIIRFCDEAGVETNGILRNSPMEAKCD